MGKSMVMAISPSAQDLADLTRLEESMWRESTRFDVAFQERSFAVDFMEFGHSGRIYTRDEIIRHDSQTIHAVLPLPNLSVRLLDKDTAQVTYNSEVTYGDRIEFARRSSIWSRSSSGWVMRFHQGTPYEQ